MDSVLYVKLLELMASRLTLINTGELYAPGDFLYTSLEQALALDFALLRLHLTAGALLSEGLADRFRSIVDATVTFGRLEYSEELSTSRVFALANALGDKYFTDDRWNERLLPDMISVVTGQPVLPPATPAQASLQSSLALLMAYDLQTLLWSLPDGGGQTHDIGVLSEDRDQMNALFRYRHGCVSLADVGLAPLETAVVSKHPLMVPVKRIADTFIALTICLIFSPLILGVLVVMAFGDGPIFYSQRRIGLNGRIFRCMKFTTMVPNAEMLLASILASDPEAHAEWQQFEKLRNDPRITRIGLFLRKTSLDELPQLLNVLRGDMSLVGPRPMAVHERERWGGHYRAYAALRPGVTGPWQVYHRTDSDYSSRITSMVAYSENWSLPGDMKYLIATLTVPFSGKGAY